VIPLTQWAGRRRRPYRGEHASEAAYAADLAAWEAEWRAEREEIEFAELEKYLGFYEREFERSEEAERQAERQMARLADEVAGINVQAGGLAEEGEDGDRDVEMGAEVQAEGVAGEEEAREDADRDVEML